VFNAGAALNIEHCTIRNLDGAAFGSGIIFQPNGAAALSVTNTTVTDNSADGIRVAPTGTADVRAVFDRVGFYSNGLNGAVSPAGSVGFGAASNAGLGFVRLMLVRSAAVPSRGIGLSAFIRRLC
jgi:hypothetical protein